MGRGVEGAPWHCAYASGAIFLVGFGHGLQGAHQSAMQLGGGQFWASYLIPCSICLGGRFGPIETRGFRSRANSGWMGGSGRTQL